MARTTEPTTEDRRRAATARFVSRIADAYRAHGIEDGAEAAERHLRRMEEEAGTAPSQITSQRRMVR